MYKKAVCFKDDDIAKKILGSTDVARIKALGRLVRNYNDSYWSGIKQIVVFQTRNGYYVLFVEAKLVSRLERILFLQIFLCSAQSVNRNA